MTNFNEMTIGEFTNVFNYLLDNNRQLQEKGLTPIAIGLEGEAGIGKTSLVHQVAEKRGMTMCKLSLSQLEEVGDHYYQMHNNRICIFRTNKGRVVYSMYSDKAAANIRLENDHYALGQRCIWRHCDLQAAPQEYAKLGERWCGFYDVLCGNDEKITMILYGESSTYPITIENYDLLVDFAHQLQKDNEFGKIERLVVQSLDNKEEFLTLNI
jgi:hypothetical protein